MLASEAQYQVLSSPVRSRTGCGGACGLLVSKNFAAILQMNSTAFSLVQRRRFPVSLFFSRSSE
jgi:hypothetical protein